MVLSDNHGNWKRVYDLISNLRSQVDYIIHCGDSEFDADDPIWEEIDGVVKGNMDYDNYPPYQIIDTEFGKLYLTHGHLDGVNSGLENLYLKAKEEGAKFIFYGHTHRLKADYVGDTLLLNPGSLSSSRGKYPYLTYAIVEVNEINLEVKYFDDQMANIPELNQVFK